MSLAENIREIAPTLRSSAGWTYTRLLNEAADRLDALEKALGDIERLGSDGEHSGDRHARCRQIARAALEQGGQS